MTNKYLAQFDKSDISIEHYDGCPAFVEMTGAGFSKALYGSAFEAYRICGSYFHEKQGDFLSLVSRQNEIGKFAVERYRKDKSEMTNLYGQWLQNFRLMWDFYYEGFGKNLGDISKEELIRWSEEIVDLYKHKVSVPGFIEGFTFYADRQLNKLLVEFCGQHNIPNYQEIYTILGAPTEPSFINEEVEDLKKLLDVLRKAGYSGGSFRALADDNVEINQAIQNHLRKYSYVKSSYAGYTEYTWGNLEQEMTNLIEHTPEEINFEDAKKAKVELVKRYQFTDEILAIAELSEMCIKWQDQRKQYTLTFATLRQKVLEEVARRANIDLELLRYTYGAEIESILDGRLGEDVLRERQAGSVFVYQGGETVDIVVGEEAKTFFSEISSVDVGDTSELRGNAASLGKAVGKVKIVKSVDDIESMEAGDILMAGMTRPEHIAGMKKAAAIVTDDGGITCHAAIVSRELGKPCIIGTKIATKVFKDGDMVEVDADKGIVRRI